MIFCQSECILSSSYTNMWCRQLNLDCYNQICLNFVHSEAVGMLKHCSRTLAPNEPSSETLTTNIFKHAMLLNLNK